MDIKFISLKFIDIRFIKFKKSNLFAYLRKKFYDKNAS